MNNEKLKQQLRDLCIAADGLATAMHLFYANVSSDILDDIIEEAENENIRQRNIRSFDKYMSKHHTVETLCGPVRLVNQDKVSKEELGEMMHHCGQDADEHQPAGYTYKDLLGMEVVCYGGKAMMCEGCPANHYGDACVKVELVGGDYLCLAKQPAVTALDDSPKSWEDVYRDSMNLLREFCIKQSEANRRLVEALKEESEDLKKPVISLDEEKNEDIGDIMAEIKEKADDFMDFLDRVVNG